MKTELPLTLPLGFATVTIQTAPKHSYRHIMSERFIFGRKCRKWAVARMYNNVKIRSNHVKTVSKSVKKDFRAALFKPPVYWNKSFAILGNWYDCRSRNALSTPLASSWDALSEAERHTRHEAC